jgi:hypothetical protein
MKNKIALCVTGWHYGRDFYENIAQWSNADVFVLSHKPASSIPKFVFQFIPADRILIEPNYGYDWGCYQQFIERGIWRNYDIIGFMHDDVELLKHGIFDACEIRFKQGHSVVANGRGFPQRNWPTSHLESYLHSQWRPSPDFHHDIVRGSFFAATRLAIEKLGNFEVFWDRFHFASYFGNWSTRASCGKWEESCGSRCFGFLSETWCQSDYLSEQTRGGQGGDPRRGESLRQRWGAAIIYQTARHVMQQRNQHQPLGLFSRVIERGVWFAARRPRPTPLPLPRTA